MAIKTETTNLPHVSTVQQVGKLKAKQTGVLANAGLLFGDVFSCPTLKVGTDTRAAIMDKIHDLAETLAGVQIQAGVPEQYKEALTEAIAGSLNPHAGLSEVIKDLGAQRFLEATGEELPADFFVVGGTKKVNAPTAVAVAITL